mmetsp:Transcript_5131/g.4270  ORF Transcript_5131/g.4270 Transcript_5131/m.4270 type:complete len:145 (-) Transcript_5131:213-647(-)
MCGVSNEDILPGGDEDVEDLPPNDDEEAKNAPKPVAFVALDDNMDKPSPSPKRTEQVETPKAETEKVNGSPAVNEVNNAPTTTTVARQRPRTMSLFMQLLPRTGEQSGLFFINLGILAVIGFAIALIVDCLRHPPDALMRPSSE